ncbi:UNVERIFIED_CONTAM: hypothetical protein Sangu_3261300 [Sesamum angustifolium]|uniref:Uncharacterized protein n=1 Tax=Sesamum angustifolium TaxID=2727405 RepID=A0AAW2JAY9_9LAMI
MLCMKEVYAVPDRHVLYAAIKAFFSTKMTKGSSVEEHGIKMLFLMEKLEDLQAGLDNDTNQEIVDSRIWIQSLNVHASIHLVSSAMDRCQTTTHDNGRFLITELSEIIN